MPNLIIGSRGSKLALWQTNWVKSQIEKFHPGLVVEIEIIKTTGDKLTEASLAQIGGKGVFTKEIEEALLDCRVDLAVHSLKDLPTTLPDGLHIAAITEREDVRDALIVREALRESVRSIRELPEGARVGTSSLRRASQLRHQRPDLRIIELRGNVETRLRKLDAGEFDATVLATAGLERLGLSARVREKLSPRQMLPAVGQGVIGIECRVADSRIRELLVPLEHGQTRVRLDAERAFAARLGGSCQSPIAAYAELDGAMLSLRGLVGAPDGTQVFEDRIEGRASEAAALGVRLAVRLMEAGAAALLAELAAGHH